MACDESARCPIGTTRLGEVCRVNTTDTTMDAEAAVNGSEAGATTGEDSGTTNTTGNQNEAGIDGGGDLTCPNRLHHPRQVALQW